MKQKLNNTLRPKFCYLKIIHSLHPPRYHPKIIGDLLKNVQKTSTDKLMTMKMRLKTKNRSNRYDINRPRDRLGHKYTKYEMYLSKMMVIFIKQHLSNI